MPSVAAQSHTARSPEEEQPADPFLTGNKRATNRRDLKNSARKSHSLWVLAAWWRRRAKFSISLSRTGVQLNSQEVRWYSVNGEISYIQQRFYGRWWISLCCVIFIPALLWSHLTCQPNDSMLVIKVIVREISNPQCHNDRYTFTVRPDDLPSFPSSWWQLVSK